MAETAHQIVNQIEQARGALDRHLDVLENRLETETDWRTQYARRPWWFLGGALVAGFLIARIVRS